jgi:hypothetical protein
MAETNRANTMITWKAEVSFEGNIDEFKEFKTALDKYRVQASIPGLKGLATGSGYAKFEYAVSFKQNPAQFEKFVAGEPRVQLAQIGGISGGMRNPHLHLGDEVVIVDKARFKALLGEVAKAVAERKVESEDDYYEMIKGCE